MALAVWESVLNLVKLPLVFILLVARIAFLRARDVTHLSIMSFLLNSILFVNGFPSAYGCKRVFFHLIENLLSISLCIKYCTSCFAFAIVNQAKCKAISFFFSLAEYKVHFFTNLKPNCKCAVHTSPCIQNFQLNTKEYLSSHASHTQMKCYILGAEDWWFERGVKESITVRQRQPSLSRQGGLWLHLF